jgi:20S proteasome subunit beta 3
MVGKECVAIASDTRFGVQAQTVGFNCPKVHKINDRCFIGLAGLATDNQTV